MDLTTILCPDCHSRVNVPRMPEGEVRCPACEAPIAGGPIDPAFEKTVLKAGDTSSGSRPDDDEPNTEPSEKPAPKPPGELRIPGFTLLAELGRGGMGVVYKARQQSLNRIVALKMIRAGLTAGDDERRRFQTEAEAVAQLQHPHIVQVYEVGEAHGQPFFVLEFVEGTALDRRLKEGPLSPIAAAILIEQLADAMEAAHRKGIVHRDLKPGNVLLATEPVLETPDENQTGATPTGLPLFRRGTSSESSKNSSRVAPASSPNHQPFPFVPKITDFGLAKRVEDRGQTQTGQILGTPSYMAPEQAAGESRHVGTPADVYALGAILYAGLTGRPPFVGETVLETLEFVRTSEPVAPGQLRPGIPRDLETICLKALRKDPAKRYLTARELAGDLRRFLNNEPVLARPVGGFEKAVKWTRRRPALAGLIAFATIAVAAIFTIVITYSSRLAESLTELQSKNEDLETEQANVVKQRDAANRAKRKAEESDTLARKRLVESQLQNYALTVRQIFEMWDRVFPNMERARGLHAALEPRSGEPDYRSFEWHYLNRLLHPELQSHGGYAAGFDLEGRLLIGTGIDLIWIKENRVVQRKLVAGGYGHLGARVSRDAKRSAAIILNNSRPKNSQYEVTWRLTESPEKLHVLGGIEHDFVVKFGWSPDSTLLALGYHQSVRFVNARPRLVVWRITDGKKLIDVEPKLKEPISGIAISPDSKMLAASGYDGTVVFYEIDTEKRLGTIRVRDAKGANAITFSPKGDHFYTAGASGIIEQFNPSTRIRTRAWRLRSMTPSCLDISPDGKIIAVGTRNSAIVLIDTGRDTTRLYRGHTRSVQSIRFSPDGSRFVSVAFRQTKVWDALRDPRFDEIDRMREVIACVRYSPDGQWMVYGSTGEFSEKHPGAIVRSAATGRVKYRLPNLPLRSCGFSPNGRWLAVASGHLNDREAVKPRRRRASLIDMKTGRVSREIEVAGTRILHCLFRSNDELLLGCADGTIHSCRHSTGKTVKRVQAANSEVLSMAISGDGRTIFARNLGAETKGWDLEAGRFTFSHTGNPAMNTVATSPDGRYVAVPAPNPLFDREKGPAAMHRVRTGREVDERENHISIIEIATGRRLIELAGHSGAIRCLVFSADSKRMATGSIDGTIKIWDIETGHELLTLRVGISVVALAFSPDSQELLCATGDGRVMRWGRSGR